MSEFTEAKQEQLLKVIRKILPDAIYSKQGYWNKYFDFMDECRCYSEWTTESCSFRVTIAGTLPEEKKDQIALDKKIEDAVEAWVYGNLIWSGCECCGEDFIGVSTILYNIEQEGSNSYR